MQKKKQQKLSVTMFETLSVWESAEPNQHITANDWGFGVVTLILNVFF